MKNFFSSFLFAEIAWPLEIVYKSPPYKAIYSGILSWLLSASLKF